VLQGFAAFLCFFLTNKIVTKYTVLQFNEKYYAQIDGVAMGSPIAPLMADIFMNWLIDNVNKIGCSPLIICRYVDDIFCTFDSKEKMDQFFYNLNKVHSNVSFSKEVEADGQLAYLDVLLTKTETGIESTTYSKDGQPVAHWMLRSGALNPFDDMKVSHSSLISVILFFLHVLSSNAIFLLDQSGLRVVKNISIVFFACGNVVQQIAL